MQQEELLGKAALVLKAFQKFQEQTTRRAELLLESFSASGLKDSFRRYRDQTLSRAEQVLLAFVSRKLHHFDLFHKVGFTANEERLSDAVAALLDPRGSHQLGTRPLKLLLEKIRDRAPAQVKAIMPYIGESGYIQIHRERMEGEAIPDIEIVCKDFIIFIENKIQGGKEIFYSDEWQTDRHWEELQRKGKRLGIPPDRLLAIFLNPEWKRARNENFVSLSVDELVSVFRQALDTSPSCSCSHSIQAFLEFYSWGD